MSKKARRIPERIDDIREAIGNADQVQYRRSGESRKPEESRHWAPAFALFVCHTGESRYPEQALAGFRPSPE